MGDGLTRRAPEWAQGTCAERMSGTIQTAMCCALTVYHMVETTCGPIFVRFGIGHTRNCVQSPLVVLTFCNADKEAAFFMATSVMRITLKAYDHELVDQSAQKIIDTVKKNGEAVSGPVPLPTKKEVVTILRAVHKYKDSREQFEQRTHKRLIDILSPTQATIDSLSHIEMPVGVDINIRMK